MVPSSRFNSNGLQTSSKQDWLRGPSLPSPLGMAVSGGSVVRSALPCLVFLLVYSINDRARILPRAVDINCVTLYNVSALEVTLFSFAPHRVVSSVQHIVLDVLAALPYLLHYLIPVAFPVYLCVVRRADHVSLFFRLLGCSMWAHYAIWFLLPTAPPWVFDHDPLVVLARTASQQHPSSVTGSSDQGTSTARGRFGKDDLNLEHREGCAFARLDQWTGIPFFYTIFNGNPVPFASFPSGHVAWPVCVMLSLPAGTGRRGLFVLYIIWVSWATMYSCHHYLLDILAAILITLLCQLIVSSGNNCFWRLTNCSKKRRLTKCYLADVAVVVH